MNWNQLLTPFRYGSSSVQNNPIESRSQFQRDYDRIIFSSPFRRLQNKTQVFPLPGSIFVHNRLTHSLEVASVGRSLGNSIIEIVCKNEPNISPQLVEQIPTIIATACLAHDLGNPPFGHSGEEAIRNYFLRNQSNYKHLLTEQQWHDLIRFEGNANALRLLTHQFEGRRPGGFRLNYPVLGSVVKYPWVSDIPNTKKFGVFQSEWDWYTHLATTLGLPKHSEPAAYSRHPLVYLVEAADDICYQIMDLEDAHKLGILEYQVVESLFLAFFNPKNDAQWITNIHSTLKEVTDRNEMVAFLRAMVIGKIIQLCSKVFENNYSRIMEGEAVPSLINQLDSDGQLAIAQVRSISVEKVYNHRSVVEIELAGYKVLSTLLDSICPAMLMASDSYSKKILRLIPEQYRINPSAADYDKLMRSLDFVSGMTDVYALELYRTLTGIEIPGIS